MVCLASMLGAGGTDVGPLFGLSQTDASHRVSAKIGLWNLKEMFCTQRIAAERAGVSETQAYRPEPARKGSGELYCVQGRVSF